MHNVTVSLSKDREHILFTRQGTDPEVSYFYYIPTAELKYPSGVTEWFRHLGEKNWFTTKVSIELRALIEKGGF